MEWLTQNWIWLVLVAGVAWMLSRGRHGGSTGCCGAHDHEMAHEGPAGKGKAQSADALRTPAKGPGTGPPAEQSASSHQHGKGGFRRRFFHASRGRAEGGMTHSFT